MSLPLHNGALAVLEMQFPGKDNARSEWLCVYECVRACMHSRVCIYVRVCVLVFHVCVCKELGWGWEGRMGRWCVYICA